MRFQGKEYRWENLQTRSESNDYEAWERLYDVFFNRIITGESDSDVYSLGLVESAIGFWVHSFALGVPSDHARILTPDVLGHMIRGLVTHGEVLYEIEVDDSLKLTPISEWKIKGTYDPSTWTYEATFAGPNQSAEKTLPRDRVVHLTWSTRPDAPWKGISPLSHAGLSAKLATTSQSKIYDECFGMPVGALLPLAGNPKSDRFTSFKNALKTLKGRLIPVESKTASYSAPGAAGSNPHELKLRRIGADVPESMRDICMTIEKSCVSALQVPLELVSRGSSGDGTGQREAFRRWSTLVISVGKSIAAQIGRDLDTEDLSFSWDDLTLADVNQRARAYKSLIDAGMSPAQAAGYALAA